MLQADRDLTIPEETQRVAKAAFPKGNVYMQLRDVLGQCMKTRCFGTYFRGRGNRR
jgi:transposase